MSLHPLQLIKTPVKFGQYIDRQCLCPIVYQRIENRMFLLLSTCTFAQTSAGCGRY